MNYVDHVIISIVLLFSIYAYLFYNDFIFSVFKANKNKIKLYETFLIKRKKLKKVTNDLLIKKTSDKLSLQEKILKEFYLFLLLESCFFLGDIYSSKKENKYFFLIKENLVILGDKKIKEEIFSLELVKYSILMLFIDLLLRKHQKQTTNCSFLLKERIPFKKIIEDIDLKKIEEELFGIIDKITSFKKENADFEYLSNLFKDLQKKEVESFLKDKFFIKEAIKQKIDFYPL